MAVTAKVRIYAISPGLSDDEKHPSQSVQMAANYADGKYPEWAYYTPAINVAMTVRSEVVRANQWEVGKAFILTFEDDGSMTVTPINNTAPDDMLE